MTARRTDDVSRHPACDRLERRLDEGGHRDLPPAWRAHVASCDRCARAWTAARAVDALLGTIDAPAPPGFTDAVMRRVAEEPRRPWNRTVVVLDDPMPWWVRVASQPSTTLAAGVAALVVWKWAGLLAAGRAAHEAVATWAAAGQTAFGAAPVAAMALAGNAAAGIAGGIMAFGAAVAHVWEAAGPTPQAAALVGILPALWWASAELVRWAEGLAALRRDPTLH